MCLADTSASDKNKAKYTILATLFHNYADAWDDERGMMILDKENGAEPIWY